MGNEVVKAFGTRKVEVGGMSFNDSNQDRAKMQYMKVPDREVVREVAGELKEVPKRLRKLREVSGFTLQEAGEMVGVGRERLRQYESGISIPSMPMLLIFAAFYGVSLDWLCGKEEW